MACGGNRCALANCAMITHYYPVARSREAKMPNSHHHVVVLGASPKPTRFANQAVRLLKQQGYRVTPVHPRFSEVEQLPVVNDLAAVTTPVDTLTLYVGPAHLAPDFDKLLALRPARVIFNPGTESGAFQTRLDAAGIPWIEACTLIMLSSDQF